MEIGHIHFKVTIFCIVIFFTFNIVRRMARIFSRGARDIALLLYPICFVGSPSRGLTFEAGSLSGSVQASSFCTLMSSSTDQI